MPKGPENTPGGKEPFLPPQDTGETYLTVARRLPVLEPAEHQPIGYAFDPNNPVELPTYSFLKSIDCGLGEPPIQPPGELQAFFEDRAKDGSLYASVTGYQENRFTSGMDGPVRRRFDISDRPAVIFGGQGSVGLIKTALQGLPDLLRNPGLKLATIGPHFPEYVDIIKKHGIYRDGRERFPYSGFVPDVSMGANDKIEYLIDQLEQERVDGALTRRIRIDEDDSGGVQAYRSRKPQGRYVICVDNPNNPTGDHASFTAMSNLAMYAAKHNHILMIDEAYGDFVPDEESSVPLADNFNNVMVVRSYSKAFMPGLRLGYMVASSNIGTAYRTLQSPFEVDGIKQMILKDVLTEDVVERHVQAAQGNVIQNKAALIDGLVPFMGDRKTGQPGELFLAPTHPSVPIMLLQGPPHFYNSLTQHNVITERGSDFGATAPLDNSWVRMRVPSNGSDVNEIITRINRIIETGHTEYVENGLATDRLRFVDQMAWDRSES